MRHLVGGILCNYRCQYDMISMQLSDDTQQDIQCQPWEAEYQNDGHRQLA